MNDKRTMLVVGGLVLGGALIVAALGVMMCRQDRNASQNLTEVIESAKVTVDAISEAVNALKLGSDSASATV